VKLETLSLRGVLRFSDTQTLDLRALQPGLIGIVAPNGAGKTSLLESPFACLYREFPSRDREMFDYVTRADGFIETTFELEGQGLFRARLALDGPHRKAEAILARIAADGSQVILNGDSKVSTYDAAIRQFLPDRALVLASVFAAQNRSGSFAKLDKKGKKDLFAKLLGLDHYEELAKRAKQAADLTQQSIDSLSARRDLLASDASQKIADALDQLAQQLQIDGGTIELRRADLGPQIGNLDAALTACQEAAAQHAAATSRQDAVLRDIGRLTAEHRAVEETLRSLPAAEAREVEAVSAALEGARRQHVNDVKDTSALDAELQEIDQQEAATHADADRRIQRNQELAGRADAIRAAVESTHAAQLAIKAKRQAQGELMERKDALTRREQVQRDALSDVLTAERELASAHAAASRIGNMPFGEDCAPCGFLVDAVAAKAQIPGLEERVAARSTIEAEIQQIAAEAAGIAADIHAISGDVARLEEQIASAQKDAAAEADLAAAEERIKGHERRKTEATELAVSLRAAAHTRADQRVARLDADLKKAEAVHASALGALRERFDRQATELNATRVRLGDQLEALSVERNELEATIAATAAASVDATRLTADLAAARQEWDETTSALASVRARVEDLNRRREEWVAKHDEWVGVTRQVERLTAQHVEWTNLAKAFGRDGLPVLEIDAAGPTISGLVNDLLRVCGMGRFSVDLVTQEAKVTKGKDGSLYKDSFELKILDAERGGEPRDLSDLSGGEQVIVDEALKLAIAIYVNQRNVAPIRTMFRDETTGALDPENALRYMSMLRRAHEIGGFHHTLFVSHNPDCYAMADAQVHIADGQISVQEPPYAAAAEAA